MYTEYCTHPGKRKPYLHEILLALRKPILKELFRDSGGNKMGGGGRAYSADIFFYFSQFKLPYDFLHWPASSEIADFMDFIYLALNEDHLLNVISNLCTF